MRYYLQTFDLTKKKEAERVQLNIQLEPEDAELRQQFVNLVGRGGLRLLMVNFMKVVVESKGQFSILSNSMVAQIREMGEAGSLAKSTAIAGDQDVDLLHALDLRDTDSLKQGNAFDKNQNERYYHQMLSEVLHSGIEEYRRAIIANVEGWSRAAKDYAEMQTLRQPGGNVDPTPVSKAEDPADTLERARRARELAENDRKIDPKPKKRNPGDAATGS